MSRTSTDAGGRALAEWKLSGPTMGTRWSATVRAPRDIDVAAIEEALAAAVDRVDQQMSTWKADSDLMRLNRAAVGERVAIPAELGRVLATGLKIGRQSNGAFDIGLGDLVNAWGFGAAHGDPEEAEIRHHLGSAHAPAHERLELSADESAAVKRAPIAIDLSGIAKGFGVDEMIGALTGLGIEHALAGLDGELRGIGTRGDGRAWTVAVEEPDYDRRAPLSAVELADCAVATSGDYRHYVDVGDLRLSHSMDRRTGGPAKNALASVTVMAKTGVEADAWATALLVMGESAGPALAEARRIDALFIERTGEGLRQFGTGPVFGG